VARKTKARSFRIPRPSLGAGSWRRRIAVGIVAIGALAAAYFGWFRDSPLVAVRDVKVEGVSGTEQKRIEKALTKAAEEMTTLHVREDALAAAAASFPDVKSVSADPSPPSGLTVTVVQRRPALLARAKSQTLAVAEDGALLPGVEVPKGEELPAIDVSALPESGRLEGPDLEQALVVGAAPEPLRPLIEKVSFEQDEGVVTILKGGLPVHFGTGGRVEAKWAAASAVLADPKLKRLTYVDVRVPERAAAGGSAPTPPQESEVPPVEAATAPDPATAPVTPEAVAP
jgi:cell division protein FtsQ